MQYIHQIEKYPLDKKIKTFCFDWFDQFIHRSSELGLKERETQQQINLENEFLPSPSTLLALNSTFQIPQQSFSLTIFSFLLYEQLQAPSMADEKDCPQSLLRHFYLLKIF